MSIKIKNDDGSWSTTGGARDASFAEISGNPSENPALNSALLGKQDEILTNIPGTGGQVLARTTDNTALEFINAGTGTGTVTDVIVDGTSVVTAGVADIDLTNKVDKVIGKGLSSNDYTTAEKIKVASIPAIGVGDGVVSIHQDGVIVGSFSTNQTSDTVINITSPSVGVTDVKVDNVSVVAGGVANINGKAERADLLLHTSNTSNPHSVTKAQLGLANVENKNSVTIRNEITAGNVNYALGYIPLNEAKVGIANGVAQLGSDGKVPEAQLPSYVDQIIEVNTYAELPIPGETNKIYVILSGAEENRIYRWGGSVYAEVTPSLALGETSSTAFVGDKGKIAYNHSQTTGGVHISAAERARWNSKQDSLAIDQLAAVNSGITLARVNSYESHLVNISNPHSVTKGQIGLGNVDNTKDVDKPVSTAQQAAINTRLEKATVRADIVYGRINETDVLLPYNKWPSANSIVQRLDGGRVKAGTPTENTDVTPKLYVDGLTAVDDATIERGAGLLKLKDSGVEINHINASAISTAIPSTGAVDTKLASEKAVADCIDALADNVTLEKNASNKLQLKDAGIEVRHIKADAVSTVIPSTGAVDTKLATEKAVADVTCVDDTTIERNTSGQLQVKDKGVTLAKLADQPSDIGKIYAIHDDGTTILKTFKEMFLNMMYPVASRYIQLQGMPDPNTFGGVWEVDTDYNGRSIWCDSTQALGSTVAQALPKPTLACDTKGSHSHSIISDGSHYHSRGSMNIKGSAVLKIPANANFLSVDVINTSGAISASESSQKRYYYDANVSANFGKLGQLNFDASNNWTGYTSTTGSHAHGMYNNGSHNHSITVTTAGVYGDGTKVQPDAITCIVWKRTA